MLSRTFRSLLVLVVAVAGISVVHQLLDRGRSGTAALPAGYLGRSVAVSKQWKLAFQDDFLELAAPGGFLNSYPRWAAYTDNFITTAGQQPGLDRGDHYATDNLSVQDAGPARVLNCRLLPKSLTSDERNWGAAPSPRFDVGFGVHRAKSMKVEMRVRILRPAPGWHIANLVWFDDKPWPTGGEIDFWEQPAMASIGAFFHYDLGTTGNDKVQFSTDVSPTDWHIIGFEFVSGRSYRQFLDGVQVGQTITERVPSTPGRIVLQNEPAGDPTQSIDIQYDWITVWTS